MEACEYDEKKITIKNHRRVIFNDAASIQNYFVKLYEKLIYQRCEQRKAKNQHCFEVFFKVPASGNDPSKIKMKRFYLKLLNQDVLCVADPQYDIENHKLKFIHSLLGCHFIIKPPSLGTESEQINSFEYKSNASNTALNKKSANNYSSTSNNWWQIQIKLSEKHKRVFFVKNEEQAQTIVKTLSLAAGVLELKDSPYAYV